MLQHIPFIFRAAVTDQNVSVKLHEMMIRQMFEPAERLRPRT